VTLAGTTYDYVDTSANSNPNTKKFYRAVPQ
jgi:hypothetical protein